MMISINNPAESTYIFIIIFLAGLIIWARRRQARDFFPSAITQELKGLAILAIIFSHIGYFLISGQNFLFPLSIMAGVGVNLFLFLSGYGLTASFLKNKPTVWQFYRRRLIKLCLPLWLTLIIFFLLDYFSLNLAYSLGYVSRSFLGFFPHADLFSDLNSPLWYITLILFYYLLFPLAATLKNHRLSALAVYLATSLIVWLNPSWLSQVMPLYKIHLLSFPLGMLLASLYYEPNNFLNLIYARVRRLLQTEPFRLNYFKKISYWALVIIIMAVIAYTAYYSNVGNDFKEEFTSVITMLLLVFLFLIKKINFGIFYIFGIYSYEIYLLHWPILSRYEMFYRFMPAWLATALYLLLFLTLGIILKKVSDIIVKKSVTILA